VLEAFAGDPVRLHVIAPSSDQNQVFSVEGHSWAQEPGLEGTPLICSLQIGGLEAVTLRLDGGAGGVEHQPGTYVYGNHRLPYEEAGQWGIFRVLAPDDTTAGGLLPLASTNDDDSGSRPLGVALIGGATIALLAVFTWRRSRRRSRGAPTRM